MNYNEWLKEVSEQRSLLILADDFLKSGHDSSSVVQPICSSDSEMPALLDMSAKDAALQVSFDLFDKFCEEWQVLSSAAFYVSFPCLSVSIDDTKIASAIHTSFSIGVRAYEPNNLTEEPSDSGRIDNIVATHARIRDLLVFEQRSSDGHSWLFYKRKIVKQTLSTLSECLPKLEEDDKIVFLTQLSYFLTQCAGVFYDIQRGISKCPTDARLGALVEMTKLCLEAASLDTSDAPPDNMARLSRDLLELAVYSSTEFELATACGYPVWQYNRSKR